MEVELDQDNLAALTEDSSLVEQVEARHMVEVLVEVNRPDRITSKSKNTDRPDNLY